MIKLNAAQLRAGKSKVSVKGRLPYGQRKNDIYIVLDNVLDTYNVGSIFRLADAVGAKKVYLCGDTPIPPNPRIKKASINTTEWVEWEYSASATEAISNLKNPACLSVRQAGRQAGQISNLKVVAVEQSPKSASYNRVDYTFPLVLVVGHETYGVSKEVLDIVDQVVEIPMFGVNISLNVMVSLAIVLYQALESYS